MADAVETIPNSFSEAEMEGLSDLPNPQSRDTFDNGRWVHRFGDRGQGPLVMVHGTDTQLSAVIFPEGVLDVDGNELEVPASIGPRVFLVEGASKECKGLMAAYAAKTALEAAK